MTTALPRVSQRPLLQGHIKACPKDFRVSEMLEMEFSGDGEFEWIQVRKTEISTAELARQMSSQLGVAAKDISWSGLKDRQAVAEQWFSVHLPGKSWPQERWSDDSRVQLLQRHRHRRKLRRGSHRGNRFWLRLPLHSAPGQDWEQGLQAIAENGFPNYFGEQRFGRGGDNLRQARRWLLEGGRKPGRQTRGMLLSSLRSELFNRVLSARVTAGSWNHHLPGDVLVLRDSGSVFASSGDAEELKRIAEGDLHPTGPLPGKVGKLLPQADSAALEAEVLAGEEAAIAALERVGVDAARRSLRCMPDALQWHLSDQGCLELTFGLPSGCFATVLVRELGDFRQPETGAQESV